VEDGVESLYFLTAEDTSGTNLGALYKLEISQVPEPGSIALVLLGGLGFGLVRMRRVNAPATR
jgi:hypothetical protein